MHNSQSNWEILFSTNILNNFTISRMYLLESVTVTNRFNLKKIKLTFVTTMKLYVRHYSTKLCDNFVD